MLQPVLRMPESSKAGKPPAAKPLPEYSYRLPDLSRAIRSLWPSPVQSRLTMDGRVRSAVMTSWNLLSRSYTPYELPHGTWPQSVIPTSTPATMSGPPESPPHVSAPLFGVPAQVIRVASYPL